MSEKLAGAARDDALAGLSGGLSVSRNFYAVVDTVSD